MSTRSNRLILVVVPLSLCCIIIFVFSTLSAGWKIAVVLGIGAITYGLWRANKPYKEDDRDDQNFRDANRMSLQELSTLLEYNDAIISILNEDMHTLFRSPAAARITGWPDAEFGLRTVADHCHPEDCGLFSQVFYQSISSPDVPHHISFRLQHKQGHYIWLDGWITNMLHRPAVRGVVSNFRDVTGLKKMAAETEKSRRFYQFLSEVNHMIVHVRTEEQLFSEACRIAVTTGSYWYAFIALKSEASGDLSLHSYAGSGEYNNTATGSRLLDFLHDAAVNVLNNEACFIETMDQLQIQDDPSPQENESLKDTGSQLILLRVSAKEQPVGIAGIWSAPGYLFDEAEISLLKKMAADISFSLSHLREEQLRLKTQRDLQESEQRYQVLAESAPVGIFHTDETGYTTYVNPRWREISGMKKSSVLGDDWLAAVHPADRERLRQGWHNATQVNRTSSTSEYRFLKPDGSIVYVLGLAVAQTNFEGAITGYIGTIIDITDRKKAEQEILALLQEVTQEKTLSDSIINSLPGVFYLYNRQGRFIRWNENFSNVSGYSDEMISSMHPLDFFTDEEKEQARNQINQTFETGEATLQADFLTATGRRIPYYFTGRMLHYKGEPCLLGVGIDFTERVMSQRKIRETNDQLRLLAAHLQDVREEERKSIGREIHDELGQTLTAIKMDIAWINKRVTDDEILANKLKNVTTLLDRSNHSVRRILTQLRPGIFQSGDLLDAIGWLTRQFSETSGIEMNFTCNREPLQLPDAVSTCIFRVTQEALTNITRYAQASTVQCTLLAEGEWIELTIQDDGRGFDPALVASHKSFGLLGMKERVLSLGGSFELTSGEGKGTKILVRIHAGNSGHVSGLFH